MSVFISGPVLSYTFKYKGRVFYFFGDVHGNPTKMCGQTLKIKGCDQVNFTFTNTTSRGNGQCYSIIALIHQILSYNSINNIPTNFFLEWPMILEDEFDFGYPLLRDELIKRRMGLIKPIHYAKDPQSEPIGKHGIIPMFALLMSPSLGAKAANSPYSHDIKIYPADTRQYMVRSNEILMGDEVIKATFFSIPSPGDVSDNIGRSAQLEELRQQIEEYLLIFDIVTAPENSRLIMSVYLEPFGLKVSDDFIKSVPTETNVGKKHIRDIELVSNFYMDISDSGEIESEEENHKMTLTAYSLLELSKIDPEMTEMIKDHIYTEFDKSINLLRLHTEGSVGLLMDFIEHRLRESDLEDIQESLTEIKGSLTKVASFIFDASLLAKLMLSTDDQNYIYTGVSHTEVYATFFSKYLQAKLVEKSGESVLDFLDTDRILNMTRCIEMGSIKRTIDEARTVAPLEFRQ